MSMTIRKTRDSATIETILHFNGEPVEYLIRPIPTTCQTASDRSVMDIDGCGGTGWICPTCHEGDECVGSDHCHAGTSDAQSCVCEPGQTGNWAPSTWA